MLSSIVTSMHLAEKIKDIQSLSGKRVDLTLTRVAEVAKTLKLLPFSCPIIVVGGTNGKGSTVATLESIYLDNNYQTSTFTSPHIHEHTELIRINGNDITATQLQQALDIIDASRGKVSLSEFEFITLAALWLFRQIASDVVILEVGLGGQDDAVNIVDADVAVITNVTLDHCQWLGNDRNSIGKIKAGIMRPDKIAISGEYDPPESLLQYAKARRVKLKQLGKDFDYIVNGDSWTWQAENQTLSDLPLPNFVLENIAAAIMVVTTLMPKLPIHSLAKTVRKILPRLFLPGRMQMLKKPCQQIFDVAHNPAAASKLAEKLASLTVEGKTHAVFSMFADKDIEHTIKPLRHLIDIWHIAKLQHPRAAPLPQLQQALQNNQISSIISYENISAAYQATLNQAIRVDVVIVFGSFQVLNEIAIIE